MKIFSLSFLVFCCVFLLFSCDNIVIEQYPSTKVAQEKESNQQKSSTRVNFTERDLSYEGRSVKITHHARCRMDCREIDAYEIQEIIDQSKINERKTKRNPKPGKCPAIAYEGYSRDKQHLRIIVGDCDNRPIIITVIDLENEYKCSCK